MQKTFFSYNYEKQFCNSCQVNSKNRPKETSALKESDLNKLRAAALSRPCLCAEVSKIEITGLSECFKKSNKSQFNA